MRSIREIIVEVRYGVVGVVSVVSVVGIGHGQRWMSRVRRVDEWFDIQDRSKADRERRATTGKSELVGRSEILLPDRQSAELAAAARRNNPAAINTIPMEYVDDTLGFNAEWVVDASRFASKGKNTPLDGATLKGQVVATIVGGEVVYDTRP